MKNLSVFFLLLSLAAPSLAAQGRKQKIVQQEETSVSLAATHLLPSAFVIPGGRIILGTTSGIGLFDIMDVTTNLYLDFNSVFNVSAKINVFGGPDYALGIFGTYTTQSLDTVDPATAAITKVTSTSISPGVVFSYRILPSLVGHAGFEIMMRNPVLVKGTFKRTSHVKGNTLYKEFTLGLGSTFALSVGGSYDTTYDISGAGASFHIGGFQIGAHYYFNVETGSVIPLIGGGYTASF